MTDLEEVVREALSDQVREQPHMTEPASRAIIGAAAVRRRRALLAAGAIVIVLVAAVSGGVALHGRGTGPTLQPPISPSASAEPPQSPPPSPTPSPASSLPAIGMSALVQDHTNLLTQDGRLLSLSALQGQPGRGYQIAGGWLVSTFDGVSAGAGELWLLRPDGSALRLLDQLDADVVVSPDGRRLAWRSAGKLMVGHLDGTGAVATDASTPAPQRGDPLAFAGSAVLIGYSATGGGVDNFDVWVPQQGRYTPSWDQAQANGISSIYGATADGRWLLGMALATPGSGGKDSCLARIDPLNRLRVVARACGLPAPGRVGRGVAGRALAGLPVAGRGRRWLEYDAGRSHDRVRAA
jgi:hypothetical protein